MHSCIHLSGFCLLCGLSFGCFLYYLIFLSCVLYILCGLSFRCFIYYGPFFYCRCFCLSDVLSVRWSVYHVWSVHRLECPSNGLNIWWSIYPLVFFENTQRTFICLSECNQCIKFILIFTKTNFCCENSCVCIFSLAYYSKQKNTIQTYSVESRKNVTRKQGGGDVSPHFPPFFVNVVIDFGIIQPFVTERKTFFYAATIILANTKHKVYAIFS